MSVWSNSRLTERSLRTGETVRQLSWVLLVIGAFFLLLWEQAGNASMLYDSARRVADPSIYAVLQIQEWQRRGEEWWRFLNQGASHLEKLESEVRALQVDSAQLEQLRRENESLRGQLVRPLSSGEQVAQWYGSSPEWFIDLGCQDGIQEKALVTYDGAFVGVTQKVHTSYSTVRTWEDPSWRLATKVGTESAYGVFSFARSVPEVEEVPASYTHLENAFVVTAGQEDVPPDFVIGQVQEVLSEPGFGTVRLVLDPIIDHKKLNFVRVAAEKEDVCQD